MNQGSHSTELKMVQVSLIWFCWSAMLIVTCCVWVPFYHHVYWRTEKQKRQSIHLWHCARSIGPPCSHQGSFHQETSRWWFPCHLKLDVEWPGNRKPLIASVVWRVCFQHKWDASCGQTPDQRSSLIVIKIIKVSWWYSPAIISVLRL